MPFIEAARTRSDVTRWMTLAAKLGELMRSWPPLKGVPDMLVGWFGLQQVRVALTYQESRESPLEILAAALSPGSGTLRMATGTTPEALFQNEIPKIHQQILWLEQAGTLPHLRECRLLTEELLGSGGEAQRHWTLVGWISGGYRLILQFRGEAARCSELRLEELQMASEHLLKILRIQVAVREEPARLGAPFDRLTHREWSVLWALDSEDGEKQLADRLQLSPHTLHSHIKTIYRKLSVQGRLPALLRLHQVIDLYRMKALMDKDSAMEGRAVG